MVDVDWGSASPVPSLPKPFIYIFWFQPQEFKKSSKPNCAISFHQIFSPTATSWKAGWCLQDSLTDQSTPSLLRHACCPKGLSGLLLTSSKSSTGQQQMKGRHLARTKLLQDCSPQLLTQTCTCSCLAPSLLTCNPRNLDVSRSRATMLSPVGTPPMLDILHLCSYDTQTHLAPHH